MVSWLPSFIVFVLRLIIKIWRHLFQKLWHERSKMWRMKVLMKRVRENDTLHEYLSDTRTGSNSKHDREVMLIYCLKIIKTARFSLALKCIYVSMYLCMYACMYVTVFLSNRWPAWSETLNESFVPNGSRIKKN